MLNRQLYIQRRTILKETIKKGIILFLGNEESPMNYPDNPYPFRQHSSFLYFFGIDRPSVSAIIDIDNGQEIIFGDELTLDEIVWMGQKPTIAEEAEKVGVFGTRFGTHFSETFENLVQIALKGEYKENLPKL